MPYTKTTWVNGVTKLNATNMNKIEDGIFNAVQFIETPTTQTTTLNSTNPIVSVTDSVDGMADVEVGGATLNQVVVNGDFANGTTGWTGTASTLSASSKILSVTGNGGGADAFSTQTTTIACATGRKVFIKARMRVTNSVSSQIYITINGSISGTALQISSQLNPIQNQWYNILGIVTLTDQTGNLLVRIRHTYADAATANGKVMEVDGNVGVFAIPITGTPYESMTADQINNIIGEYWEGLKSVERVDVVSSGRNLFDKIKDVDNAITIATSTYFSRALEENRDCLKLIGNASYNGKIIKAGFKINTQYTMKYDIKNIGTQGGAIGFLYTDGTTSYPSASTTSFAPKTIISTLGKTVSGLVIAPVSNGTNYIALDTFMLNEGSTALTYQPYDGSKLTVRYTDRTKFDGALLPNLKDNEVNLSRGYLSAVKRVQRYVLQSGDIGLITTPTNADYVTINKPIDYLYRGSTSPNQDTPKSYEFSGILHGLPVALFGTGWDNASNIGKIAGAAGSNTIIYFVPKGTYANLAAAQAALAGTVIYYELAQPIFIPCESFGTYGIEVDGVISTSDDYTQLYLDNYNLLPPTPIVYPTNIAASVQGLKNAVEILNTKVDTVFLEGQATTDNTGWTASGNARFPFRKNVAITGVAATHVPIVNFTLATYTVAEDANIAYTESYDGGVTLYAETTPTGSVTFDYSIIRG